MRKKNMLLFISLLLLISCAKHAKVATPVVGRCDLFEGPLTAPGGQYVFWTNHCGKWFAISKTGPNVALKELCPKGVVCSTENVGQMYFIERSN